MTRILTVCVSFTVLNAQQYVISTYAGGAPASPELAISLAADSAGNVYFADGGYYGGFVGRSNSVFKIDSNGSITRVAGNSRTGFSGDGGPALNASLSSPRGVALDRVGNLFIVDAGNQRVRKVTPNGVITTVAGGGSAVLGDGGPATSGQLNYPTSIVIDAAGSLFIGEYGRVRKVASDGIITTVAGGGANDPSGGGPATAAQLHNTTGIAVDSAGNLFINDYALQDDDSPPVYNLLRVSAGGAIAALSPSAVPSVEGEPIAVDGAGNLYLVTGAQIWKISLDGTQTVVAGKISADDGASSGDGGPAVQAQLSNTIAVAVDSGGELLIGDSGGQSVRKISNAGIISTIAKITPPTQLPSGDGGPATGAQLQLTVQGLSSQSGLAIDDTGNLYIAETGANRVRKVSPSGIIATVAGVGGPHCPGGPFDCLTLGDGGPATSAAIYYPTAVAVDAKGDLFIADSANARVRKVAPDGTITTVAGNGNGPTYPRPNGLGDGGSATNVPLVPWSVAVDGAGNLFISEGNFGDVRKVSPEGTITTAYTSSITDFVFVGLITAIAADRNGNLFVAGNLCETSSSCFFSIRKISPAGVASLIAGAAHSNSFGDGGLAVNAQLGFTTTLAVDSAGNLFLTDILQKSVRKIDTSGIITTIAGNGLDGYSGDGGPATNAALSFPFGLAVDRLGDAYVSDFNQVVRVLKPAQ